MWMSTSKKLKFILTNLQLNLELVPNSHFWLKKIGQNLRKKNQKIIQNKYYVCYLFAEPTESPTQPPPTEHLSNIEAQISIEFENVEKIWSQISQCDKRTIGRKSILDQWCNWVSCVQVRPVGSRGFRGTYFPPLPDFGRSVS